jgi:hypothetical protein
VRIKNTRYRKQNARYNAHASAMRLVPCLLLLFSYLLFVGCRQIITRNGKKQVSSRVTLKSTDKIPYGTFVAQENLAYMFPEAIMDVNELSPASYRSFVSGNNSYSEDSNPRPFLYVIISPYFSPTPREYQAIMAFVGRGNHVFISAFQWGKEFTDSLKLSVENVYFSTDSLRVSVLSPVDSDSFNYTYPGRARHGYFSRYSTNYATVLGRTREGRPNFIQQTYEGGGSLFMHTSPLAFSNFFLLHKSNINYYNNVFSYLPRSITHIEWDEYFRYGREKFNSLQVVLDTPPLAWALWLLLAMFLIIYLFESKRRQRVIPKIPPLRNASLDFVKTIGRLYYQYRDNKNLGMKMNVHLLAYVRQRYNIPASLSDERFVERLAYKSGYPADKVQKLVQVAKMMNESPRISDEELMEYHKLSEDFYKHQ